ncbi:thioredoxin trx1 [Fusarium equiseti]|uniref:Thioredoxin n=1 Tax=Fusarium equiseti TaxID=61235 RepID=A0ABQ8R4L7_FUSEQ|nr:thioredoxin trx1 [Fusarium equiseti]
MTVIEIKDLAHYQELINNNKVVIIDAWAVWCGPCRFISPIFEQLSEREEFDKSGVVFAKVDVDQAEDVSQELAIRAMPTFFTFYDGELQDKLQGADPNGLERIVKEVTSKV